MKKVLLIEDNIDILETTAALLELEDYEVISALNGAIGVEKAKQTKPDVIVCDIMMPGLDGFGVFEQLHQDARTSSLPFIFLTAKSEKSDMRRGMKVGADDYLTKPFEIQDLIEAIESRIKKHDFLRKEFSKNVEGLNEFLKEASKYQNLEDLSKDRELKKYKRKEEIFSEGKNARNLYFVESGTVKTCRYAENGKEYVSGLFKAGDFIGQLALLGASGVYTETAVVLEKAEICTIPKEDFTELLFGNKDVSNKFIGMISNDLIQMQEHLLGMAFDPVRKRAASMLLELHEKGLIKDEINQGSSISREDFAGLIGTATETAIRVLSSFKDEGLIELGKSRKIRLSDKKQLEYVSNFA